MPGPKIYFCYTSVTPHPPESFVLISLVQGSTTEHMHVHTKMRFSCFFSLAGIPPVLHWKDVLTGSLLGM